MIPVFSNAPNAFDCSCSDPSPDDFDVLFFAVGVFNENFDWCTFFSKETFDAFLAGESESVLAFNFKDNIS